MESNILKVMIGIKLNKFISISFSTLYKEIVFPNFKIIFSIKKIGHPLKLLNSINKSINTFYIIIFIFFRGGGGGGYFLFYFIHNKQNRKMIIIFQIGDIPLNNMIYVRVCNCLKGGYQDVRIRSSLVDIHGSLSLRHPMIHRLLSQLTF